jgi:hypothetical protein
MTLAYRPYEGIPEFTAESYDEEVKRLQSTEPCTYETVEVPAWHQNNELGIIYKHPHEPKTERALVLVKGLGASRGAYLGLQTAMAELGYPVIAYKSPRKQDLADALKCDHIKNPTLFQSQGLRTIMKSVYGSEKIRKVRGGRRLSNFVLGGHSNGTPISAESAYHERIRKPNGVTTVDEMISIGGAGQNRMGILSHAPSLGGLGLEIVKNVNDIRNAAGEGFAQDALEHISRSLPRVGREAIYVASRQSFIMDKVDEMRLGGMPFGAIILNSDGAFDADKLEASLEGHTDYMRRVDGPHVLPNAKPREFAPHLAIALDSLDHIDYTNRSGITNA